MGIVLAKRVCWSRCQFSFQLEWKVIHFSTIIATKRAGQMIIWREIIWPHALWRARAHFPPWHRLRRSNKSKLPSAPHCMLFKFSFHRIELWRRNCWCFARLAFALSVFFTPSIKQNFAHAVFALPLHWPKAARQLWPNQNPRPCSAACQFLSPLRSISR